jgi:phosphatidylserine decarboxylase
MRIHREGLVFLTVCLIVLIAASVIVGLILPVILYFFIPLSLLLLFFLARFFRVPKRSVFPNNECIYSPADGTVVAIEEVEEDEYLKTRSIQVSVFMSIWNVHINWFPTDGTIKYYKYHPGDYLVAWHPKSSSHNERTTVVVERSDGVKILIRQIAGALARRIVCYAKPGLTIEQGSELGFIKFGSRVDLFLPLNANVEVKLNDRVVGKQTVIARL